MELDQNEELEKKLSEERKTKIRLLSEDHRRLSELARQSRIPLAALIRMKVLDHIRENPLPQLAAPPRDEDLIHIEKVRPEALVYTVPIVGSKIISSRHPDGGWRGLLWEPSRTGSVSTWRSDNLSPPPWAQKPRILNTLIFIASRIEENQESVYKVPRTDCIITANWSGKRFDGGRVINIAKNTEQEWSRHDWYAMMASGNLAYNPNTRRLINMLCRVLTAGDGGLTTKVPLQ